MITVIGSRPKQNTNENTLIYRGHKQINFGNSEQVTVLYPNKNLFPSKNLYTTKRGE